MEGMQLKCLSLLPYAVAIGSADEAFSSRFYDDPRVIRAYEAMMERGIRPKIAVHSNVNDVFARWAKKGRADLFYVPKKGMPFEVGDGKNVKMPGEYTFNTPSMAGRLERKFDMMEKYPIPPEKVDEIFAMIRGGALAEDILMRLL